MAFVAWIFVLPSFKPKASSTAALGQAGLIWGATVKSHSLEITSRVTKLQPAKWKRFENAWKGRAGSTAARAGGFMDDLRELRSFSSGFYWELGQLQLHGATRALPAAKTRPWCHQLNIFVELPVWVNGFSSSSWNLIKLALVKNKTKKIPESHHTSTPRGEFLSRHWGTPKHFRF